MSICIICLSSFVSCVIVSLVYFRWLLPFCLLICNILIFVMDAKSLFILQVVITSTIYLFTLFNFLIYQFLCIVKKSILLAQGLLVWFWEITFYLKMCISLPSLSPFYIHIFKFCHVEIDLLNEVRTSFFQMSNYWKLYLWFN